MVVVSVPVPCPRMNYPMSWRRSQTSTTKRRRILVSARTPLCEWRQARPHRRKGVSIFAPPSSHPQASAPPPPSHWRLCSQWKNWVSRPVEGEGYKIKATREAFWKSRREGPPGQQEFLRGPPDAPLSLSGPPRTAMTPKKGVSGSQEIIGKRGGQWRLPTAPQPHF